MGRTGKQRLIGDLHCNEGATMNGPLGDKSQARNHELRQEGGEEDDDVPPENPYRSKLEIRSLRSAPSGGQEKR